MTLTSVSRVFGKTLGRFLLSSTGESHISGYPEKSVREARMEHGSFNDHSNATFSLADEDHTLANAVRFTLNQDPRVTFCGYSIPHPAHARVNIRVQTTGDPAREVMKDACQGLMLMNQHIRHTFEQAVKDFKGSKQNTLMNDEPGSD